MNLRQSKVLNGQAVVASMRPKDSEFLAWAKERGLLVKVDRSSKFGNPYPMNTESERDSVCEDYQRYLFGTPDLLAQVGELKGKVLACWCYPKRCHADLLASLANGHEVNPKPGDGMDPVRKAAFKAAIAPLDDQEQQPLF